MKTTVEKFIESRKPKTTVERFLESLRFEKREEFSEVLLKAINEISVLFEGKVDKRYIREVFIKNLNRKDLESEIAEGIVWDCNYHYPNLIDITSEEAMDLTSKIEEIVSKVTLAYRNQN